MACRRTRYGEITLGRFANLTGMYYVVVEHVSIAERGESCCRIEF